MGCFCCVFLQLFHEDGECWVYDEPLLKRLASQRHWGDSGPLMNTKKCIKKCTQTRVFIRTLWQKPLLIQALGWLIEYVHCFAFDCKKKTTQNKKTEWKHQRCNLNISKPFLFVWAISPPLASDTDHLPTWDCSAETRRLPAPSVSSTTSPFQQIHNVIQSGTCFPLRCFREGGEMFVDDGVQFK